MLPDKGRFYLQTMVFGRNDDPGSMKSTSTRPRDSDAWYVALMGHQFPGSWLPFGSEQIVKTAAPDFRLVESSSGRLDYIETIKQWRQRFGEASLRKTLLKARLVPRGSPAGSSGSPLRPASARTRVCFERELLEHYRFVFEKA